MTIQNTLHINKDYIVASYQAGKSTFELGKEFNCNSGTVWYYLNNLGLIKRKRSKHYGEMNRFLPEIKTYLEQDVSAYRIAKLLGISKGTVLNVMKKHGLSTRHKSTSRRQPLNQHSIEIAKMYTDGASTCEIAERFDTYTPSILKVLAAHNIKSRPRATYTMNHAFFDVIDSAVKAYVLGFFYADGNNLKNGHGIRIQITDLDILERMKVEFEYDGPILPRPLRSERHKRIYSLILNSKRLSTALTNLGCPANKTFILRFPDSTIVPPHLLHHFVRGYFDGDGSIGKYSCWRMQFCGTKHMMEGIQKASGIQGWLSKRHPERNNDNWTLSVYRKHEFPKFVNWLYKDATIYLSRKHNKYLEFLASTSAQAA